VLGPLLDWLRGRKDLDLERVGLMGISMGGIYGPRAAAVEKRLRAVIRARRTVRSVGMLGGAEPAHAGRLRFYTKSRDENEAFEKGRRSRCAACSTR